MHVCGLCICFNGQRFVFRSGHSPPNRRKCSVSTESSFCADTDVACVCLSTRNGVIRVFASSIRLIILEFHRNTIFKCVCALYFLPVISSIYDDRASFSSFLVFGTWMVLRWSHSIFVEENKIVWETKCTRNSHECAFHNLVYSIIIINYPKWTLAASAVARRRYRRLPNSVCALDLSKYSFAPDDHFPHLPISLTLYLSSSSFLSSFFVVFFPFCHEI